MPPAARLLLLLTALGPPPAAPSAHSAPVPSLPSKKSAADAAQGWRWVPTETSDARFAPSPREGHSSVSVGRMLVSFGGCAQDRERCFNDVGLLDTRPRPRRWRKPIVYGRAPAARGGHTATLVGEHMYVFGGAGAGGRPMNDVAVLDLQPRLLAGASGVAPRMAWGRPALTGALPARREGHSATLVGGSRIFVFGGFSEGRLLNDVAVLATGLLAWQRPDVSGEPPSPREGHVAAAAGDLGLIAVFGGFGGAGAERGALADLVVLDTRTMAWTRPQHSGPAPSARERAIAETLT